ncbi:pentatricopeptide repeat-containing protein At3g26540 [Ricinus communis]|uniref:Pentatricopeptide repeat-containing protein, putative n=1 Tax=Ricinus communis TaxID=3988 RepID=B9SVS3_RICCO|nr:pentatricopeptide repeat-containing protein At3g26540 [Ricinus communis]XP_048226184.1 pentatricopeptide repeat-containing protein At3g26540 [Ricinus communis]XP_048226185.1 pentatricopeptide repeat-containing protein At3g26540 [Ricinus communis]XP_048226186.1 pentatricopeptide repeat-containing protein At3g26540 [Ricinus communis]XP_048226187.1 pentatricopeptide repeat-containing protein At3g26540 [Ricinus communis]XP_048226188.1 pentatricopeptide repeat-containing protein At3g26540 [Ricin|eukprot:XP_002530092.1 pentatricopeptide repeat-containing protein At3g26540 [Ricinus communis]
MSASSILNRILSNNTCKTQTKPTKSKALTNTIINHLKANRLQKAVSILFASNSSVPYSLYASLFQLCSSTLSIVEARKIESHLITFNPTPPIFLLNRAIETYGKCECLKDARELFDEMPQRDGGSWNAIIKAYTQCGYAEKALGLFKDMNKEGVFANEITFASVLKSCSDVLDLSLSRQIHGLIVKCGFCGNVILGSALVDVYGKCKVMSEARLMFNEIENCNDVTWNVIVRRYLDVGNEREAVKMFFKMFQTDVRPLNFTFSNALIACSAMRALNEGMQIHAFAIKIKFEEDEAVSSSLSNMYAKCGKLESARMIFDQHGSRDVISWTSMVSAYALSGRTREARELFEKMPEWSVVSWNAMLAGYIRSLQWEEALDFVCLMRRTTEDIDHITLGLLLNVCAGISDVEMGKQAHGFIYRHGFSSCILVGNALLDMYGKCGNLRSARVWFYQMSQSRDNISWNALLTSYARHHQSEQAMMIFGEMQWETKPSTFTFGTLLAACANIFALDQGKEIHGFMIRNGYNLDTVISGALVDMYSKCRCLSYALTVFNRAGSRDVILWNSIILGCCHNGRGKEVLKLFGQMEKEGVKPDHVTFHGVLLACMYEGHVKLAVEYFNSMSDKCCVIPRLEHYECMIELFSRYRCMSRLENFVKGMPFDPTASMLIRVFDACKEHGPSRFRKWVAEQLNKLNPSISSQFQIRDEPNRQVIITKLQIGRN